MWEKYLTSQWQNISNENSSHNRAHHHHQHRWKMRERICINIFGNFSRILFSFFSSQSLLSLLLAIFSSSHTVQEYKRRLGLPARTSEWERDLEAEKFNNCAWQWKYIFSPNYTNNKTTKIAILHFLLPSKCEESRERGLALNNFCILDLKVVEVIIWLSAKGDKEFISHK